MTTLFISDLHLEPSRPDIGDQFEAFLRGEARDAETLYILGDLFEAWIGDDEPDPYYNRVQDLLADYSATGVRCYFMHGNRDFLIGEQFAERTGFDVLDDPVVHEIYGTTVLLSHGDRYCTDDHEYQAARRMVRDPAWQQQVLSLPVEARRQLAGDARAESSAANADKSMDIMDVNAEAIEAALRAADVDTLLHGHTHRPAVHDLTCADGRKARRIVLGDWYTQGSVGRWTQAGFELAALPR
ncbi:MAG: UDP-2,3-diacylglucosamine diphosphatase [Pseudomonadota bacterium]